MPSATPARLVLRRTRQGSNRQAKNKTATVTAAASAIHPRSDGKAASRNAEVSRSMIIRSTKSTVIQSLSNLNRDSSVSATTNSSDSRAATAGRRNNASQKQLSKAQTSRNAALATQSASVAAMTASAAT